MTKRYDRAYFEKWYRGADRVNAPSIVRRKAALAVSVAEYFLGRPVRNVLDVGCGEGAWRSHLRALRPAVEYLGLDTSAYAVRRFGRSRNIQPGSFGELGAIEDGTAYDLVVCSDVLHYVPDEQIAAGAAPLARLCAGVAFLEVLTAEDDIVGDLEGMFQRPASWYRSTFRRQGLVAVGPYSWLSPAIAGDASPLQRI